MTIPIDRQLDGWKQVRCLLNFINHHRTGEIADEPGRVASGQRERGGIIQGEILTSGRGRQLLSQRGFARLPRAVEQHDGSVGQGSPDGILNVALDHGGIFTG